MLAGLVPLSSLRAEPVSEMVNAPPERVWEAAYRYLWSANDQYEISRENREMRILHFKVLQGGKVIEAQGTLEVIALDPSPLPSKTAAEKEASAEVGKEKKVSPAAPLRSKITIEMKKLPREQMIYLLKKVMEKFRSESGDR